MIWVGPYCFIATGAADWHALLRRAGMAGGTILVPDGATPGDAWCEADLRMARLVICSCGDENLDPDNEGFSCLLCARCYDQAGWDNAHSDNDHDTRPVPECPSCDLAHADGC